VKLWLISQDQNNDYDTYHAAVVAAETEEQARRTCPRSRNFWSDDGKLMKVFSGGEPVIDPHPDWATDLSAVKVRYIGEAALGTEAGVVLASLDPG
jgi:hypothetical protein